MPTVISYKRLFEIRILHEYFLLGFDEPTFFNLSVADREAILVKRIQAGQYRLNNDIEIVPNAETQRILNDLNWRFVPTATGFAVAARTRIVEENGVEVEKPFVSLPAEKPQLYFHIRIRNKILMNYTFVPLLNGPHLPIYYFGNRPLAIHTPDFVSLSLPVGDFDATKTYEMGDIAKIGGVLQEAKFNTNSNANTDWLDVSGDGYANAADRICLPKRFTYRLNPDDNILAATFTLKRLDASTVKTLVFNSSKPLKGAFLDFFNHLDADDLSTETPDGVYLLEVSTSGPVQTFTVFLSDAYEQQSLGLIHIDTAQTDPVYSIFNPNNSIRDIDPDPSVRKQPVFEIRLRSRRTYWRYIPKFSGYTFQPDGTMANYLEAEGDNVITRRPQLFTFLPYGVLSSNDMDPPDTELPSPLTPVFKPKKPDRLVTEIRTLPVPLRILQ